MSLQRTLLDLDVSCAHKKLGGPAACSISGKYDDKYFKLKPEHETTLQEREK
jgi:hypothetical protein